MTASPLQSVVWLDLSLTVPADWEIVRHCCRASAGRLVWVDRYEQRLLLSWAACPQPPDAVRLFADYQARDAVTEAATLGVNGWHGYRTKNLTRAGCHDPHHGRWIEMTITAPGQETALLESFAIAPPGERRVWRAFGVHLELPAAWTVTAADIQPGATTLTFQQGRHEMRLRRLGMVESWFDGDVEKFLRRQIAGEYRAASHPVHPAGQMASRETGRRWEQWLGRLRARHDMAWHCPVSQAVFHLTTLGCALLEEIAVHCCEATAVAVPASRPARSRGRIASRRPATGPVIFTGSEMLAAVPVRNEQARSEPTDRGDLVVRVPLEPRWYLRPPVTWLLPLRRDRAVCLDRLGQEIWRACDGERTVEEIVEAFAARHHLRFHEARLSVMAFLRELTRRGVVAMVVPRTPEAGA